MKAEIGSTSDWALGHNGGHPYRVEFKIPMLPPSVNAYVRHPTHGVHVKTKVARGFEDAFPLFARDLYVVSQSGRFSVTLEYTPGPGQSGDIDNFNKLPIDCAAKRGMFRNKKNQPVSDAWVKRLLVIIHDRPEDRERGPQTLVTIEAWA